jgi:hypothetical protein
MTAWMRQSYKLKGIRPPFESCMFVRLNMDHPDKTLTPEQARDLARDLTEAADKADESAAQVRRSLLHR